MRKIISLTLFLQLLPLTITSIVLYIVPHGRVAYWADWKMWGLSKTQWGDMHTTCGAIFCLAGAFHLVYNWKALLLYMKKARAFRLFTKEFNVALILTLATLAGTYFMVPPFSWVLQVGEHFKAQGTKKYGSPPYGHAELSSVKTLCKRMSLDLEKAMANLDAKNMIFVDENSTILELSQANNKTPQEIYVILQGEDNKAAASQLEPGSCGGGRGAPPPVTSSDTVNGVPVLPHGMGVGKMTVMEIARKYAITADEVEGRLSEKNIAFTMDQPLKEIAAAHGLSPHRVYEIIIGR